MEHWKDIPGYKGLYQISNLGRIKSLNISIRRYNGIQQRDSQILKPLPLRNKYLRIVLVNNGQKKQYLIHRLVAMAFIPNPDNKPCIDHKDGNRANNNVDNLCWVTHKENSNNPLTLKRLSESQKGKARKHKNGHSKPVYMIKDNVIIKQFESMQQAAAYINVKRNSNIADCCNGKRLTAYGYNWKFVK